ncbi:MAG: hypothetical protein M1826_003210 [Phylliscum demangeonii]|nr:MAG: hypothetical protein M1826_003210 [Phylliscum demangeonii]
MTVAEAAPSPAPAPATGSGSGSRSSGAAPPRAHQPPNTTAGSSSSAAGGGGGGGKEGRDRRDHAPLPPPSSSLSKPTAAKAAKPTGPRGRDSGRPATAHDLLAWFMELRVRQGAVGLHTDWPPGYFSSMHRPLALDAADANANADQLGMHDIDLSSSLGRAICDVAREDWLEMVCLQHRALIPRMMELVDAELLLACGADHDDAGPARLRGLKAEQKVAWLIRCRRPAMVRSHPAAGSSPPPAQFVVYLITPRYGDSHEVNKTKLFFPPHVTFAHFIAVLRGFTLAAFAAMAGGGGNGMVDDDRSTDSRDGAAAVVDADDVCSLRDGPWIYMLVGRDKHLVTRPAPFELADHVAFRAMVGRLLAPGSVTPAVSIYHAESRMADDDRAVFGEMDERDEETGGPYFEPVDWPRLAREGIGGTGFMGRPVG